MAVKGTCAEPNRASCINNRESVRSVKFHRSSLCSFTLTLTPSDLLQGRYSPQHTKPVCL